MIWHVQQLPRHGTVYAVRVVDRKSGRTFQTNSVMADLGQDSLCDILRIQDCNFDGYPDFYFFNYMGNVNSTYNFLLYDHNKGKFVFNEAMATLTDPWFDLVDSIIGTSFRASASDHGIAEYRFKGDSLYKTALWEQDLKPWPDFTTVTIGKLSDSERWTWHIFKAIYMTAPYKIRHKPHWYARLIVLSNSTSFNVIDKEKRGWFHVRGDSSGWVKKSNIKPAEK